MPRYFCDHRSLLWFLATINGNQMSLTMDLTRDECAKALSNQGACFPYFPKTEGVTLRYKIPGSGERFKYILSAVSVEAPASTCEQILNSLDPAVAAKCVPVPVAHEECPRSALAALMLALQYDGKTMLPTLYVLIALNGSFPFLGTPMFAFDTLESCEHYRYENQNSALYCRPYSSEKNKHTILFMNNHGSWNETATPRKVFDSWEDCQKAIQPASKELLYGATLSSYLMELPATKFVPL
jgi:hypothetical protein